MDFEAINDDLINNFSFSILNRFSQYCNKENKQASFSNLIKYLIETDVIREKTVAKYMVMKLYPECLYTNTCKMDALTEIADLTGISRKHVYNMVQHPERFSHRIKEKGIKKNKEE
jgi:hypothetical protein